MPHLLQLQLPLEPPHAPRGDDGCRDQVASGLDGLHRGRADLRHGGRSTAYGGHLYAAAGYPRLNCGLPGLNCGPR
jgi:hypothetical protein